jgi:hypothetical protein
MLYIAAMTKEKTEAIIGRLTVEYSEAKHHIGLLENHFRHVSELLEQLIYPLRRDPEAVIERLKELPDKAELIATADELAAEKQRVSLLRDRLRDCGVSV